MSASISAIKGFNDIIPGANEPHLDAKIWQRLVGRAHGVFESYNFVPVFLPALEQTGLFSRGLGDGTDIVQKEMYSLTDRGGRQMTLRPEGTAGAARAYIEHNFGRKEAIQRWYYLGPFFRAERPQKGRYRQFHQLGGEVFGIRQPAADVELLLLLQRLFVAWDLGEVTLRLNTLGDAESRVRFAQALKAFLQQQKDTLCDMCRSRIERSPLRVLDCKNTECQAALVGAPDIMDALSDASKTWFHQYLTLLTQLNVKFVRDKRLVRGLDYYSDAIFEFNCAALGAQDAICGGGRYDTLMTTLGGPPTPAVGFAIGLERVALLLSQQRHICRQQSLFIVPQDGALLPNMLRLAEAMREHHACVVEVDTSGHKVKQALRRADKIGVACVAVVGLDEEQSQTVNIKRLLDGKTCRARLEADTMAKALATLLRAPQEAIAGHRADEGGA